LISFRASLGMTGSTNPAISRVVLNSYDTKTKETIMGKGDKRSRRGKINSGTFGKTRPAKAKKKPGKPGAKRPVAPKKR